MCFEVGLFSGEQKAFIVLVDYEQLHPDETRRILRQAVDSFIIKK